MERKRLRNILITLFVLALLILGFWFGSGYLKDRRSAGEDIEKIKDLQRVLEMEPAFDTAEAEETVLPEPEEEAVVVIIETPAPEEKIERHITDEHTVKKGESFSLITGFYWEDIFLWPDLYIRNRMHSDDPDLIYPDEIITIYNRLGRGEDFSTKETSEILEAYLEVYRIYKKLGDRKNNSVWSLLWCAARYDHDFLDKYRDRIDPEDRAMAQKYIDEQGFLD
ncbi:MULTISPECIES: LysM peptidoglycan-binding domain-containing protein [unclassified Oceanispirochaeta]|uniref:LysM peptidoglycan-binding domain-containing protein n=1 Tax=unclassified Oceanispirochaeta TaxID=2635722 RepID=UPI000E092C99|nr:MULTISPECIES: hypothetical protein [unclassified Oceanispirochaeta]MBF9014079.1 hypothetical protein [Oceanispirochaeta sp. M2]NPD70570.1 hypothetical protein [Oceanispirochaeta sp. M1]RDG34337.1 hypothetical protein DV872_00540 [Oceanispirochaeta sp. M1]